MKHLFWRFVTHPWTPALLLLTYLPSLLMAPLAVAGMVRLSSLRDWVMVAFAAGTIVSYGIPAACAASWVSHWVQPEPGSPRARRVVVLLGILGWLPHHLAVACWVLVRGVQREGLVP